MREENKIEINQKIINYIYISISLLISYFVYEIFRQQSLGILRSDVPGHTKIIKALVEKGELIAHPFFHLLAAGLKITLFLSYERSVSILLFLLFVLSVSITERIIGIKNRSLSLFISCLINISPAFFSNFFLGNFYAGTGGVAIYHNPTLVLLKPVALFLYYEIIEKKRKCFFYLVPLTVFIKPSFAMSFLPFYFLLSIKKASWIFKEKHFFACSFISLAFIYFQYTFYYTGGNGVEIRPFAVWNHYSPSPFLSYLLANLFPLCVFFFYRKKKELLIFQLTSALFCILFAEKMNRFYDGNFFWTYFMSIYVFFVISFKVLLSEKRDKRFFFCCFIFTGHVITGILYIKNYLSTHLFM